MKRNLSAAWLAGLALALSSASFAALAQAGSNEGYWTSSDTSQVWKDGSGSCWRAGYWTPAMATEECDPELVKKPMAPAPMPAPAAAPAPMPHPVAQKVTLSADVLFDFDKSVIKPAGKEQLDQLVDKIGGIDLEVVIAVGHTDRIGSAAYNQRLSVRRAEAVKRYLVSKGIEANRIHAEGKGKTQPVKTCPAHMKGFKALVECLAPNRRVEIEVIGTQK
jgi:OmpA-OmpF porin, OOP family